MSFPTNKLPEAFEEEHGSLDLDDAKPSTSSGSGGAAGARDYGGDDEDLDLPDQPNNVWLCKVRTRSLSFRLSSAQRSARDRVPPTLAGAAASRPRPCGEGFSLAGTSTQRWLRGALGAGAAAGQRGGRESGVHLPPHSAERRRGCELSQGREAVRLRSVRAAVLSYPPCARPAPTSTHSRLVEPRSLTATLPPPRRAGPALPHGEVDAAAGGGPDARARAGLRRVRPSVSL